MPERTCATCDVDITHRRSHAKFCSRQCKDRARTSHGISLGTRRCRWCDHEFAATTDGKQTYCSRRCAARDARVTGRTCEVPWERCRVCTTWIVSPDPDARCPSHQHVHPRFVHQTYSLCRNPWCDRGAVGRSTRRYCSDECRLQSYLATSSQVHYRDCPDCGALFSTPRPGQAYCSEACRRPHRGRIRISKAARLRIYKRDGWRCQLCRGKVDRRARYTDRAPSLDHIIPRSLGGTDQPHNLQLAHRSCNTDKGTDAVGEQLRIAC